MKIEVRVVGRLKEDYFQAAEAEYLKRVSRYESIKVFEHRDETHLIKSLPKEAVLIALDEAGALLSSREFAQEVFAEHQMSGRGAPLVFVIGGADGISDTLRPLARTLISFGRMTMGHRIVRIVLLEQIYRAMKILRNEPYHRD